MGEGRCRRLCLTFTLPHKSMLQRLVSFLVPFEMANHFFLFDKNSWAVGAFETMEMFPIVQFPAVLVPTLGGAAESSDVTRVVHRSCPFPKEPFTDDRKGSESASGGARSFPCEKELEEREESIKMGKATGRNLNKPINATPSNN